IEPLGLCEGVFHVKRLWPCIFLFLTILVPRVGRFMGKSILFHLFRGLCLPQDMKRHLSPFFHVVHPSHLWSPLLSYSRNSTLHYLFLQTTSFFSHHMTEV